MPFDTYEQAIEFLFGRINYERTQADAYTVSDFKLDRMRELLARLGDPHLQLPAVHVAGTKGKGSTCSMLASVLTASGCRTGLYTSPHLVRFEERMRVDGRQPTPAELVDLVNRVREAVAEMDRLPARMHPTYFEIATVLAWLYFLDQRAELVVLETGLGGRLDSTNLCDPWVTCITNVSRDHMPILGNTVREIAGEKAGIIKPGIPLVSAARHPDVVEVLTSVCNQRGAPFSLLDRDVSWRWTSTEQQPAEIEVRTPQGLWPHVPVPLLGDHQAMNTAVVVAMVEHLIARGIAITPESLARGLLATRWPARVEVVGRQPTVILDAAHNWESTKALVQTIRQRFPASRKLLVFATTKDKDYRGLLRQLLPEFDAVVLTRYLENPRGVPIEELRQYVAAIAHREVHTAANPYAAWRLAQKLAGPQDLIVITGSFFLVGELREQICEELRSASDVQPASLPAVTPAGVDAG